jgi:translation elongation factor EF-G
MSQNTPNSGIVARVDAGKTTIAERPPDAAGVNDRDRRPHFPHESRGASA